MDPVQSVEKLMFAVEMLAVEMLVVEMLAAG
jgi:hypothetical protein